MILDLAPADYLEADDVTASRTTLSHLFSAGQHHMGPTKAKYHMSRYGEMSQLERIVSPRWPLGNLKASELFSISACRLVILSVWTYSVTRVGLQHGNPLDISLVNRERSDTNQF